MVAPPAASGVTCPRVAVQGPPVPTAPVVADGAMLIDTGTAAVTVNVVESVSPCQVAVMVVVPGTRPRACPRVGPAVEIGAIAGLLDVQVAWLVTFCVVLSL